MALFFKTILDELALETKGGTGFGPVGLLNKLEDFDWDAWTESLQADYQVLYGQVVLNQATREADRHGLTAFDFDDPFTSKAMTKYVAERVKSVQGTTKSELKAFIRTKLADGIGTANELGDAIKEKFSQYADWRADTIARTETAIAYNHGSCFAYHQAGVKLVDVLDGTEENPCDECLAANGQRWTLEDALKNATAHPNCVRSFSPVLDDMADLGDVDEPEPETPDPASLPVELPRPQGPPVSNSLYISVDKGAKRDAVAKVHQTVMSAIDSVHGDGELRPIALTHMKKNGGVYGQYRRYPGAVEQSGRAVSIEISDLGLKQHPFNTIAHEAGHWLDNVALAADKHMTWGSTPGSFASPAMQRWHEAVAQSPTMRTLKDWYSDKGSKYVSRSHLDYLLSHYETFARAYAQYIATRSGNAAMLEELRELQGQVKKSVGNLERFASPASENATATTNNFRYPTVWQDDEFTPIADAFDKLFEEKKWRTGAKVK